MIPTFYNVLKFEQDSMQIHLLQVRVWTSLRLLVPVLIPTQSTSRHSLDVHFLKHDNSIGTEKSSILLAEQLIGCNSNRFKILYMGSSGPIRGYLRMWKVARDRQKIGRSMLILNKTSSVLNRLHEPNKLLTSLRLLTAITRSDKTGAEKPLSHAIQHDMASEGSSTNVQNIQKYLGLSARSSLVLYDITRLQH